MDSRPVAPVLLQQLANAYSDTPARSLSALAQRLDIATAQDANFRGRGPLFLSRGQFY